MNGVIKETMAVIGMDAEAIVAIVACVVSIIAIVVSGLTGRLWFLLWDVIEHLRKDVSDLREETTKLRISVGVMRGGKAADD